MKILGLTYSIANKFGYNRILFFISFLIILALQTSGQTFSDNATNYGGGWTNTSNGGTGFQAWGLANDGPSAGHFRGNPINDGMSNAGIGATSFGMFGSSTQYAYALRNFNSAMAVGDIFSFYWAMNFDCGISGSKGWELRSGGTNIFGVNNGNSAAITYNGVSTGTVSSNYGTTPMLVTIQRISCDQYTVSITRRNTADGTFSVTISSALAIDNIRIYIGAQENSDGRRNMYFNAFQIQKPTRYQSRASGNWGDAAVWQISTDGGTSWSNAVTAPSGTYDIFTILNGHSITLNSASTASSLTINSGGTFNNGTGQTITFPCNGTITNAGTFNRNTGTVTFTGTGSVTGPVGFHNLNISGGLTLDPGLNASTINGTFTLNSGGFIAAAPPKYATGSTLRYNTGGTYNRSAEWPSGTPVETSPHHVTVAAGTTLNLDVLTGPTGNNSHYDSEGRTMYGDLDLYGTLTMGSNSGTMAEDLIVTGNVTIRNTGGLILGSQKPSDVKIADIQIGLNWVIEQGGFFDASRRAVIFNGTTTTEQTFTSGNAIENFGYIIVNKPVIGGIEGTVKMFCDAYVYGQNQGSIIQLLNGSLDLNGRSMTLQVRDSINNVNQNILIDGTPGNLTRRVFNSSVTTASFNITHYRPTPSPAHVDTVKRNSASLSELSFGSNIIVTVGSTTGNVGINFGSGITTINGTLRINERGFVDINPPTYATNSLLQYNTGGNYNRNVEWNASSGPGYPFNVQLSTSGTLLRAGGAILSSATDNRGIALNLAGSLTIDAGTTFDMTNSNSHNMTVPLTVGLDINNAGILLASQATGGDIILGRSWSRTGAGVFTPYFRSVTFNTSRDATMAAPGIGETFYDLIISKPSAGIIGNTTTPFLGYRVTLNSPAAVTNNLNLTSGYFVTSSANLLTINAGGSATGGAIETFVSGPLRKLGSTDFVFPVGRITNSGATEQFHYRPIAIATLGASADYTAQFYRDNPYLQGPISTAAKNAGLQVISYCEYWDLTRATGTNSIMVTPSWSTHPVWSSKCNAVDYVLNTSALRVVPFNGPNPLPGASQWGDADFGQSGTGTGNQSYIQTISWNAALNYNKFVLGSTNWQLAPLPFEMKFFKASGKENIVQLEWSVNFNQQVKTYVIERSRDGIHFESLKQVLARTNEVNSSYMDIDPSPFNGWGYYRLRITDISGQTTYTATQKVWMGKKSTLIQLMPNPAVSDLWVNISEPEKITELNLMNGIGQVLYKNNRINSLNRIDVSSLSPGIYYIRIIGKDGVYVETFVKK